ncbi:MAG: hypothetical protein JF617_13975 [Burkholderiales bacterium]|nr:hypothetical protein [Burkholderiales bacterium]
MTSTTDGWESTKDKGNGMTNILDMQAARGGVSAPNAWNDPDMLEVGNGGMTTTEYESHFSLWAMLAAPLIAGNDLSKMDADTLRILTNKDVIAVDQDPLGQQGRRVLKEGELEVWVRPLQEGEYAAVLFNRGKTPADMKLNWDHLGLPADQKAEVKDLWSKQITKGARGSYGAKVAPHGVIMVRIKAVP